MKLERIFKVPGRLDYDTRQSKYLKDTINLIELISLNKILIRIDWIYKPETYRFELFFIMEDGNKIGRFSYKHIKSHRHDQKVEYLQYEDFKEIEVDKNSLVFKIGFDIESSEDAEFKASILNN